VANQGAIKVSKILQWLSEGAADLVDAVKTARRELDRKRRHRAVIRRLDALIARLRVKQGQQ
jgi:hypothetical protein